jgi:hypothetical protein
MARMYATRTDLVAYAPADVTVPDDPEATRLLTRASAHVDRYGLLTAVYDVDTGGLPTDTALAEAIKLATCAQAVYWLATGDETGAAAQWGSVGIGSVNLSRGSNGTAGKSGSAATQLAPQADTELRVAVDSNSVALLPGSTLYS